MQLLKEKLIEKVSSIPEDFLEKAYAINISINCDNVTLKVQGFYNFEVIKHHYKQAIVSSSGFVEFSVDGIDCVMT